MVEDVKARVNEVVLPPTTTEGRWLRLLNAATLLVAASNGEAKRSFRAAFVKFIVFVVQIYNIVLCSIKDRHSEKFFFLNLIISCFLFCVLRGY